MPRTSIQRIWKMRDCCYEQRRYNVSGRGIDYVSDKARIQISVYCPFGI